MEKLFLVSSFADVAGYFKDFLGYETVAKTVTFIPTASIVEKMNFYVKADRKALERLGLIIDDLEISQAQHDDIQAKLAKNDMIYVSGGNTFYLLQELKRTGTDQLIKGQIGQGKPYVGASAGSMVLAPHIDYVKAMDNPKKAPALSNYDALAVIDFYPLPHYGEFPFKKVGEKILQEYQSDRKLYPISNHQAITVNGGVVDVIGKQSKQIQANAIL